MKHEIHSLWNIHPPFWDAGALNMALKAMLGVDVDISKSTLFILLTWPCAKPWSAQLCVSMLRSKRVNKGAARVLRGCCFEDGKREACE
jgi:hypothetical protein